MPPFDCFRRAESDDAVAPEPFTQEFRCDRKFLFAQESDAIREVARLRKRAFHAWRLNHYWCYRHQGWHVGNKPLW